jgi:hypothetical protein
MKMARSERNKQRQKRDNETRLTPTGKELLNTYLAAIRKSGRYPSKADMAALGFNRERIRDHFGSAENLKKYALAANPDLSLLITEEKIKNPKKAKGLASQIKKYKRFVVTSAVDGAPVHKGFLQSLRTYCKAKNALLVIIPTGNDIGAMDANLADEAWIFDKTDLNSNIYISAVKVPPKSVNPLTSLGRIGQRNGSTIIASPKQFLEFVAVGDNKTPHAMMSTGAITRAKYADKDGVHKKTDIIALHDHVVGAVVVEIENDKFYHFRQLQAEPSGAFVDLGDYYNGSKIGKLLPTSFVIGDYHVTETDPTAAKAWDEVSKLTGNPNRVHHDFFSGVSVNHHEEDNEIVRARLMAENRLSLEAELRECARVLDEETAKCDLVVVVDSNHHDFVAKHYVPRGKYHKDPQNLDFASKLVSPMIRGENPIRYALETLIGLKHPEKVLWLKRDESYRPSGIELGAHGDKGSNGSKGSFATLEKAYGNCVVGHSHTPRIVRGFWQVGTSSFLRLPYTEGGSSWCHSSCLVYPNGARQMINSFSGKWRLK